MSPAQQNGRPVGEGDRSENQQGGGSHTTVEQPTDTAPPTRGQRVVVRLPHPLPVTRHVLDGAIGTAPPGPMRDLLASLRAQLDTQQVERGVAEHEARELRRVWPDVVAGERKARSSVWWDWHKLRKEAQRLGIDPRPGDWMHTAEGLAGAGLPWFIMRDLIHDAVHDQRPDPIGHALRSGRRHVRRLQQRTQRQAQQP